MNMNHNHVLGVGASICGVLMTGSTITDFLSGPQKAWIAKTACERRLEYENQQSQLITTTLNGVTSAACFAAAVGFLAMNDPALGGGACAVAVCIASIALGYLASTSSSTGCISPA